MLSPTSASRTVCLALAGEGPPATTPDRRLAKAKLATASRADKNRALLPDLFSEPEAEPLAKPSTIGEMIKMIEGDLSLPQKRRRDWKSGLTTLLRVTETSTNLPATAATLRELVCKMEQSPGGLTSESAEEPALLHQGGRSLLRRDPRSSDAIGLERRPVCLEGSSAGLELPTRVADLYRHYLDDHRPLLIAEGDTSDWLWPGQKTGTHKTSVTLSEQLVDRVKSDLGLAVNMHLYRHLAASVLPSGTPWRLRDDATPARPQVDPDDDQLLHRDRPADDLAQLQCGSRRTSHQAGATAMTGKTLAFMQWPAADRAAWERLFVDGGLFGATGRGCGWSPATVGKLRYSHGRWLAYLATEYPEALAWPQHERLSRELVGAWLTALALEG